MHPGLLGAPQASSDDMSVLYAHCSMLLFKETKESLQKLSLKEYRGQEKCQS